MLDRSLIQSPSSLTTTSLPSAPTGFNSAATSHAKSSHLSNSNNKHSLHSTIQQYDSLGLPSSTTNKQRQISSRHQHHHKHNNNHRQEQENSNSFIMQQLKHLKQQQPNSTTPPNAGPIKADLIDAKFNQLAKRVLSQLNQKPVEFFHALDHILTEPLDQRELEIREAQATREAAVAETRQNRRRNRNNVSNDNSEYQYYEKTSGNIVNVTGNTTPSASNRTKAIQNKNTNHNNNHHHHSIERISSPSHHKHHQHHQQPQHAIVKNSGRNSAQKKGIFEQADSSFEIEQLVYSDDDDDFDDDDDEEEDDDESLDNGEKNYVTHGDISGNLQANVFLSNSNNGPLRGIVKKTTNSNNNLGHLNPIMRSNSLGAKNDASLKVKSATKQNVITSPNRQQLQSPVSLQKSKTSHDSLSVKTTISNINNISNNNIVQPAPRRSPNSRNSHHDLLLMSSSQQHQKHQQPTIIHSSSNNNKAKIHHAEPSSNHKQQQQQQQLDQYQALNSLYKPHANYSTSLLTNDHRLSDDDEIIIIPTKSPSLISNPSPDPDFASNSGLDNDSDAAGAAAAAANERFSISRTKSFWEKLSNNKTARGVNRRASATKSLSTSLIGNNNNNNNNSIMGNLNNNLNRVNSGLSTSENNNNIDYKHRTLTNQNDINKTANEYISTMDNQPCYDRYHYNNNQYNNY